ncbi:hypothetical protein BOTBODRAFT_428962, partial [Botryobasidium botryosum FD-172 SS1]
MPVSLPAPTIDAAAQALVDIKHVLKPPQDSGPGYKDPELDLLLYGCRIGRFVLWMHIEKGSAESRPLGHQKSITVIACFLSAYLRSLRKPRLNNCIYRGHIVL